MISRGQELDGMRFGRWVVQKLEDRVGYIKTYRCLCDCGNTKVVARAQLIGGHSKSCGCLRRDITIERSTTHGLSRSPEYRVYISMLNRCSNTKYDEYKHYGGRGIGVCEHWRKFENFILDVGPRPSADYELDRVDNEKGYEPGNVRWATKTQNARNKRNTIFVEYQGVSVTLKEVSEKTGIPYSALFYRYQKGCTGEELVRPSQIGISLRISKPTDLS